MINKVFLLGYLGRDPETRHTQSGDPVCNFSMATSSVSGTDENRIKRTEWHNIVAFKKLAELCQTYLKKGRLVHVEGEIRTRAWEKEGETRRSTGIVAHRVNFVPTAAELSRKDDTEIPF